MEIFVSNTFSITDESNQGFSPFWTNTEFNLRSSDKNDERREKREERGEWIYMSDVNVGYKYQM